MLNSMNRKAYNYAPIQYLIAIITYSFHEAKIVIS